MRYSIILYPPPFFLPREQPGVQPVEAVGGDAPPASIVVSSEERRVPQERAQVGERGASRSCG